LLPYLDPEEKPRSKQGGKGLPSLTSDSTVPFTFLQMNDIKLDWPV